MKSIICTTANKLTAQGYTRSQAFVLAWAMGNGKETAVAGTTYENRQAALERLTQYSPEEVSFTLEREPDNRYDQNAVAVMVTVNGSKPYRIGYVPAVSAPVVSAMLGNGTGVKARLSRLFMPPP